MYLSDYPLMRDFSANTMNAMSLRRSTQPLEGGHFKHSLYKQLAQLSQTERAVGCVVLARSERLELGDNILQTL